MVVTEVEQKMLKAEKGLGEYKWALDSMKGDGNENLSKFQKDLQILKVGFEDAKKKYFQMEQ